MDAQVTLTLVRSEEEYITVELLRINSGWFITVALDPDGNEVTLADEEKGDLVMRAEAGENETGY